MQIYKQALKFSHPCTPAHHSLCFMAPHSAEAITELLNSVFILRDAKGIHTNTSIHVHARRHEPMHPQIRMLANTVTHRYEGDHTQKFNLTLRYKHTCAGAPTNEAAQLIIDRRSTHHTMWTSDSDEAQRCPTQTPTLKSNHHYVKCSHAHMYSSTHMRTPKDPPGGFLEMSVIL